LKKTLQTNIAVNGLYDIRLCGYNTVYCHTNYLSQCWSEAFFHLPKFLLLSLVFAYIYISQGNAETHLPCSETYNNHIIANCLRSVPVKEFWKSVIIWRRYWQKQSSTFLWPRVYI